MNAITVDAHFGVTSAPDSKDIKLDPGARKLILDVLALQGGASPMLTATLTEIFQSTREISIASNDGNAVDSFVPGRTIRGSQSGVRATVTSQRTAAGVSYLSYAPSGHVNFFVHEVIEEVGLTGANIAALAVVDSGPVQNVILGAEVATTTAVNSDSVVDIAPATAASPQPSRPRQVRLSYVIDGSPTAASFLVRIG